MKSLSRLLVGLGAAAVTSAVFAGPASASVVPSHHQNVSSPVFVQNDATDGNDDRDAPRAVTGHAGHAVRDDRHYQRVAQLHCV